MGRLIEKLTPKKLIILSAIMTMIAGIFNISAFAGTTLEGTHAAGTSQTFTVTEAGTYEFDLYGSQGGSYSSKTGGKGGHVDFTVSLAVGDTVQIVVGDTTVPSGGTRTTGGGGTGKTSNGGGATYIKVNDTIIGVAGGGGGATTQKNGGGAVTAKTGNQNNKSFEGGSSNAAATGGGGGGYKSGKVGHYHAHSGSASAGGACYGSSKVNVASRKYALVWNDSADGYICSNSSCGWKEGRDGSATTIDGTKYHVHEWKEEYPLTCTTTVENKQSYGGTNYIATTATSIANEGGAREGTGVAYIYKLVTLTFNTNKPSGTSETPVLTPNTPSVAVRRNGNLTTDIPTVYLKGYQFKGWYTTSACTGNAVTDFTLFTQDTTLYAKYIGANVSITLEPNTEYKEFDSSTLNITRNYGSNYNLPTLTCDGLDFLGWYTAAEGGTKINNTDKVIVEPEETTTTNGTTIYTYATTLYAHWEEHTYKIYFNANGGTCDKAYKEVTSYSPVGELPEASKPGMGFLGWYTSATGGSLITENTIALSNTDMTVYAHYGDVKFLPGKTTKYVIPHDGYYKLEAWGAQGGNYKTYTGGLGGYTKAVTYYTAGTVLYVSVGVQGDDFNGGGQANSAKHAYAYGGGATDFKLTTDATENQVLVAGGGGGASGKKNGNAGSDDATTLTTTRLNGENGHTGGGGGYYGGKKGAFAQHTCSAYHTAPCWHEVVVEEGEWENPVGPFPGDTAGNEYTYTCSLCGATERNGPGRSGYAHEGCTKKEWQRTSTCKGNGTITKCEGGNGGSNYIDTNYLLPESEYGVQSGNGKAEITPLYTAILDTSNPVIANSYEVNASNTAFLDDEDTLLKEKELPYTCEYKNKLNGVTGDDLPFGVILIENGKTYGEHGELPIPSLKGWKFLGWYKEPQKNTTNEITNTSIVNIVTANKTKYLDNQVLYAHWQEQVYYINYSKADTIYNVYRDRITSGNAKFDTTLAGAYKTTNNKYRYDSLLDRYIQTVKYDHNIEILPNYYSKTGYYFKNWSNGYDAIYGGQTGKSYYESEILQQHKNGDTFIAGYGNFNYITNQKAIDAGETTTPTWSNGSNTVSLYALWEPIKYKVQFNGTNNWNTAQGSYLQNVTDSNGNTSTTIRYDQSFTLETNKFSRLAPYEITSPEGLPVVLEYNYKHVGWGFGKDTMKYDTSTTWKLLAMNTEYDPDQAETANVTYSIRGKDFATNQTASVKNVISAKGIEEITKYIRNWSNNRTDANRADKSSLESNVITSNLHSIWRRTTDGSTSGAVITFNLNGGEYVDADNNVRTGELSFKHQLYNKYYYEFDIIGNENVTMWGSGGASIVVYDAYGKKSNTDPLKNYDNATGLNYTFRKSDSAGNKYRFCGWSTEKGQISPDTNVTIDGITKNNFDAYDATKNSNILTAANNITLYAIWEPELTLNVRLNRVLGESADISGSLTNANQATVKAKGIPSITLKSGEEGRYLIALNTLHQGTVPVTNAAGEEVYLYRPIDVEVEFDPVMTGIYSLEVHKSLKDSLNAITTADGDEPILNTSNLNREITGIKDSSLSRNFHVPLYLGTTVAETYGYPSFKSDGYDLSITASRYSNFHKGIETVTAEFKIKTIVSSGEEPIPPNNTLDELRTKIKIKLK